MNVVDVLRARGIEVKAASQRGEFRICCLFCPDMNESEDTKFRLGFNILSGAAHCFNCNWASKKNGPRAILRKLGMSSDVVGVDSVQKEEKKPEAPIRLPEGFQYLREIEKGDGILWKAKRYLLDRGVTEQEIKHHRIGVTLCGKLAYRVVFPVLYGKQLVGLVARDFTGRSKIKYLNSVGEKYLYNLPPNSVKAKVVLSEGIFKSLAIARILPIASSALLGHNITSRMIAQLHEQKYRRIVLWGDPDKPGYEGLLDCGPQLLDEGFKVDVIWPLPSKQADEITEQEIAKAYTRCQPYTWALEKRIQQKIAFDM